MSTRAVKQKPKKNPPVLLPLGHSGATASPAVQDQSRPGRLVGGPDDLQTSFKSLEPMRYEFPSQEPTDFCLPLH